ncbi:tyrosine-type recombinase/integrase, partial [Bifidobacterium magnum]
MVTITKYAIKSGKTFYRVRYEKPDGRQSDKRGFKRKADAEKWAAEHVTTAIAHGAFVNPSDGMVRVETLWGAWAAKKRIRVKPSYMDDLEGAWRKYVAPTFARMPVARITRMMVQHWVNKIHEGKIDGKPKSATVVLRAYGILSGICADAVRDRMIGNNPCEGVELPRKQRKGKHPYLTQDQLFALAAKCGPKYRLFLLTLGLTGLRWGEAAALTVGDVDIARRRLSVTKSATQVARNKVVMGSPKTHEMRTVTMPKMLADMLPVDGRPKRAILFHDPDSRDGHMKQFDSPKSGTNVFSRACDELGLPRMTVHDLR